MNTPVDLTNLRSMTDGDKDMEKALFEEFFVSFETGMATLQKNMESAAVDVWRKEAHALKGIALNLGAMELGTLCKKGQDNYQTSVSEKSALLQNIKAEYARVREFLQKL